MNWPYFSLQMALFWVCLFHIKLSAQYKFTGKQIPIMRPTAICLYPAVTLWHPISLRANFGDDLENHPFKYDIEKCPGLIFE
jgi:hypothetical protein